MQFYSGYHPIADLYSPMDRGFYSAVDNPDAAGSEGVPSGHEDTIPSAANNYNPRENFDEPLLYTVSQS